MLDFDKIKIVGLKKVAGETKLLNGRYSLALFYDMNTGKIWTVAHVGNAYSVYDDPAIVPICFLHSPTTMKSLRRIIGERLYNMSYIEELRPRLRKILGLEDGDK